MKNDFIRQRLAFEVLTLRAAAAAAAVKNLLNDQV